VDIKIKSNKMKKIEEIVGKILAYADTKGFSAIASVVIGAVLWAFGYKVFAGIAFGVFLTRNWSIIREMISKKND
jgi:predicted small integral membrane protein